MHGLKRLSAILLSVWLAATGLALAQDATLTVGSKRFTESYILAEVIAQTARQAGARVEVKQGLGNTAIVFEALRSGQIDVYAEYSGTIALEIVKGSATMPLAEMRRALEPMGLGVAVPLGFNDGYALAMRREQADRLRIANLTDLARHRELKLGLSNEFIGRADGWKGLAARYRLTQQPTGLDHGIAYDAIAQKQIDVMDIYTTDAKIGHLGLLVLEDDQRYFPRYEALLLYRLDLPQKHPAAWAALEKLQGRIKEAEMIAMNAEAELQSQPFDVIARKFLAQGGGGASTAPAVAGSAVPGGAAAVAPAPRGSYGSQLWIRLTADDLGRLTVQHLVLVLVSVAAAIVIAVPLGIWLFPHPRMRATALATAGVLQTVPSLAMLAVLIAVLGVIGRWPALIALTLYSLLPILSNTCAALAEVPAGLRDAALALGMTQRQRMRSIELPIALPTIFAGIRTATAIAIGTATIAAFIGAGGLGERIVTGLALNDSALMLAGALPAAGLALLSELLFELVDRYLRRSRV